MYRIPFRRVFAGSENSDKPFACIGILSPSLGTGRREHFISPLLLSARIFITCLYHPQVGTVATASVPRPSPAYLNAKAAKMQSFIAIVLIHDRKLCVFVFKSKSPSLLN